MSRPRPSSFAMADALRAMLAAHHPTLTLVDEGADLPENSVQVIVGGHTFGEDIPARGRLTAQANVSVVYRGDDPEVVWDLENRIQALEVDGFDTVYCTGTTRVRLPNVGGGKGAIADISVVGNYARGFSK